MKHQTKGGEPPGHPKTTRRKSNPQPDSDGEDGRHNHPKELMKNDNLRGSEEVAKHMRDIYSPNTNSEWATPSTTQPRQGYHGKGDAHTRQIETEIEAQPTRAAGQGKGTPHEKRNPSDHPTTTGRMDNPQADSRGGEAATQRRCNVGRLGACFRCSQLDLDAGRPVFSFHLAV